MLGTGVVFALIGPCTLYALSPYLWADPFEFVTAWQTLQHHWNRGAGLFQGRLVSAAQLPPHYIPTLVAISTPPVTLLWSVLGVIRVGLRVSCGPREALGNTDLRFGLLLVACLILPVMAIIVLGGHLHSGWRHVYFLHAPLCGLAGLGLQWAGRRSRQAGAYALAGVGVLVTVGEMVQLHPHQHAYFSRLVDRTTPEYLRNRYELDPWEVSCREGLEFLRRRYPDTTVSVQRSGKLEYGWLTLPATDRARLVLVREAADFQVLCGSQLRGGGKRKKEKEVTIDNAMEHAIYVRKVYNNTLLTVTGLVTVPDRSRSIAHRVESTYRGATAGELLSKGRFDVYTYPGSRLLGYTLSRCTASDTSPPLFLHIVPVDEQHLPYWRRQYGFDNLDFTFFARGWEVAGQCWATVELPDYEIAQIRTGQYTEQGKIWETTLVGPIPYRP